MEATRGETRPAVPWRQRLASQGYVTHDILSHEYRGAGTTDDPYLITFLDEDLGDPMKSPQGFRWCLCLVASYLTFSVAFNSSAYASGVQEISRDLGCSAELASLGLSLFLIGFILGPLIWAPSSETVGRRYIFILSGFFQMILNVAICFSWNIGILLALRFLSGAFGAAPLTNSAGVIADTFPPRERGLAITVYALVPLFAPVLGPIVGEFVAATFGWRWLMGIMALLSALSLLISLIALPETYGPVLLRRRAQRISSMTGSVCVSAADAGDITSQPNFARSLAATLSRPFLLATHEPIVSVMALYQAVVFGTLYFAFAAFPMVYVELRGWPKEKSGLVFIGVLVGILLSVVFQLWDNRRYVMLMDKLKTDKALPEARLPGCCIGGIFVTLGLFWFAWTADPDIPWPINMAAGVPFGFGMILVTISSTNYLVDSYTIFAASAVAVCIISRAVCAATFPLFWRALFSNLDVDWALSVPAILSMICMPFPFVFYRYGPSIRARCKYAGQVEKSLRLAREPVSTERTGLLSGHN